MKTLTFLSLFIFFVSLSSGRAADIVSRGDGNWSNGGTWVGGVAPGTNDVVTIDHAVTLDVDIETERLEITINADASLHGSGRNMRIKNNCKLTVKGNGSLKVADLQFDNGSVIIIEADAVVDVSGNLDNKNNSDNVTVDGEITVAGNFDNGSHGVITGDGTICIGGEFSGEGKTFGIIPTSSLPAGSCTSIELPVELIYFDIRLLEGVVDLEWATATEVNSDYFDVERCTNGTDFEVITQIKSAGNSNTTIEYNYQDLDIPNGTIYYRLKQVDFDGKFEYFDMKAITNENVESECKINVNPNPCIEKCEIVFVDCEKEEQNEVRFSVYDALGNAVYTSTGKNVVDGKASFSFNSANNLSPAVYFVKGGTDKKVMDKKVIMGN